MEKSLDYYRQDVLQACRVCGNVTSPFQTAYGKFWYRCAGCGFLQQEVSRQLAGKLGKGEGFRAGTGVGGGGYREYWIANFLRQELGLMKLLLYGTGNTPTFHKLSDEGVDVWGSDISEDLVAERGKTHGARFFNAKSFTSDVFDAIVAVEVFEHLLEPRRLLRTFANGLAPSGIIAGTTDFYNATDGTEISDHIYLKSDLHIAYWTKSSLEAAAADFGRCVSLFELQRPGSVYPDEKFGLLWPRKRVFFIYPPKYSEFFDNLQTTTPILPIDKP